VFSLDTSLVTKRFSGPMMTVTVRYSCAQKNNIPEETHLCWSPDTLRVEFKARIS
jgi:hypothetical protein